jgi:hypothetical protein
MSKLHVSAEVLHHDMTRARESSLPFLLRASIQPTDTITIRRLMFLPWNSFRLLMLPFTDLSNSHSYEFSILHFDPPHTSSSCSFWVAGFLAHPNVGITALGHRKHHFRDSALSTCTWMQCTRGNSASKAVHGIWRLRHGAPKLNLQRTSRTSYPNNLNCGFCSSSKRAMPSRASWPTNRDRETRGTRN